MLHLLCTLQTAGLRLTRRSEDRGQTAAEYLGIVVVVALIIVAILGSDIDSKIADGISAQIDKFLN
jgi:pilus assembly protein Flp/PilA